MLKCLFLLTASLWSITILGFHGKETQKIHHKNCMIMSHDWNHYIGKRFVNFFKTQTKITSAHTTATEMMDAMAKADYNKVLLKKLQKNGYSLAFHENSYSDTIFDNIAKGIDGKTHQHIDLDPEILYLNIEISANYKVHTFHDDRFIDWKTSIYRIIEKEKKTQRAKEILFSGSHHSTPFAFSVNSFESEFKKALSGLPECVKTGE